MTTTRNRLIAALAFVLPVAALVATPAMAKPHKAKAQHSSVHKVSHHKTSHKAKAPTAS